MPTATETPTAPPASAAPIRRLQRSREQRVISGVSGGIAEYFGLDVAIVRIVIVVLSITTGVPILLYAVAVVSMPKAPKAGRSTPADHGGFRDAAGQHASGHHRAADASALDGGGGPTGEGRSRSLGAVVLMAVGALMLLDRIGLRLQSDLLWPLAFVGLGTAVLWSRRHSTESSGSASSVAPPPPPGFVGEWDGAVVRREIDAELDAVHPFEPLLANPIVDRTAVRDRSAPEPGPRRRGRSFFARAGFALWVCATAAVGLVVAVVPGLHLSLATAGAYALLWLGVLLVMGSVLGRPRLTVIGAVLTIAVALASSVHLDVSGGAGERTFVPASADALQPRYRLGVGSMTVDLSRATIERNTTVQVSLGVGEAIVIVPNGVRVETLLDVDLGEANVFGRMYDGTIDERVAPAAGEGPVLTLAVDARLGDVTIRRVGGPK